MRELQSMVNNMKVVYGALAAVIADYDVRTLYTIPSEDTTMAFIVLTEHLSKEKKHILLIRKPRKTEVTGLQQVYMVSSLPGIGRKFATRLLNTFKTPRAVFNANVSEITRVRGVGKVRALRIDKALTKKYEWIEAPEGRQSFQISEKAFL
ncbi:MAG: hypothetical protein HXX80_03540 [Nitrososphaerales archaeon]|nr:hypothetical protein [Nitrososphaerales archaeon]